MTNQTNHADRNFTEQIIKQILNSWASRNAAIADFFNKYADTATYLNQVAPGRNRAIYLLAHLISANDGMLTLFGLGEKLFPELDVYTKNPDRSFDTFPPIAELKRDWEEINMVLTEHFNKMSTADWLAKHTSVSEEDFAKDPQRNKLNALIGRTNHMSYHLGQLNLLTVKELAS